MAYKRRSSMIQGSRLHKEKLALNCSMDNTSGPDGRANSSAFQHNNHGGAEFIDNHFPSGMHRSGGPMQKHEEGHNSEEKEPMIAGETGQTSDYEREFMNDMIATGQGPRKPKTPGAPYRYKNGYHLPKKKTEGPLLETEKDIRSYGNIAARAAGSGALLGPAGAAISLIKNINKRKDAEAYNAGFEQSDSDAMEL